MNNILTKVTYHTVYDESIMSALEYAKANGFAGVQVAVETPHLSFDRMSDRDFFRIAEYVEANRLILSLHGPDHSVSLFETDQHLRRGMSDYWSKLFSCAQIIGAKIITFHAGNAVTYGTDTQPRIIRPDVDETAYRSAFHENLRRLIEIAAGRFTLCLENYKLDTAMWDVVRDHLRAGHIFLCWDLAKTYRTSHEIDEELERFFLDNLIYIRQVHLHDLDGKHSHKVIGSGNLDFPRFLSPLARANVLEYCIEVRPREKAVESLVKLREGMLAGWQDSWRKC